MDRVATKCWLVAVLFLLLSGCSRGPEPGTVEQDLQKRIDEVFGDGLLRIHSFRRYGSQPLTAQPDSNGERLAVYYKVGLQLQRDHHFSDWRGQGPGALYRALNAAEKGIEGVQRKGNLAGDVIYAHGLGVYIAQADGAWISAPFTAPDSDDRDLPATAGVVAEVDTADTVRRPRVAWPQQFASDLQDVATAMEKLPLDSGIAQLRGQLQSALTEAKLQVARESGQIALLSGPGRGDYHRLGEGLKQVAAQHSIAVVPSSGAIENIRLLSNGLASLAFTQSDLAVSAYSGGTLFDRPATNLRAVAALYPEPVQVVVRVGAGIAALPDLAGKRVNIGPDGTGTQINARQILALAGVDDGEFFRLGIGDSLDKLMAGHLDALFITSALPSRYLQHAGDDIALLPLNPELIEALSSQSGYIPYQIPTAAYPQVASPVKTVAVTAMLVADVNAPDKQIADLLEALFESSSALSQFGERGGSLQKEHALTGVTVPLHPAAEIFFQQGAPASN